MVDSPPSGVALLVVDVQEGAVARGPYRGPEVVAHISALAEACRRAGVEVIYVQHDGGPGEDEEPGSPGWPIHGAVAPHTGERVIRKRHNSAFRGTPLEDVLDQAGIRTLLLVGIQTEYCVDTTCRVAFELGFEVVVPREANTTFDNGELSAEQVHRLYNDRIWDGRFATVRSVAQSGCLSMAS